MSFAACAPSIRLVTSIEGIMRDDFLTDARSIASRLDLANSDLHSRRIAEQDMRALGLRFMGRALRAALASLRQRIIRVTRASPRVGIAETKPASLNEWQV
jgi:hypothetical protein